MGSLTFDLAKLYREGKNDPRRVVTQIWRIFLARGSAGKQFARVEKARMAATEVRMLNLAHKDKISGNPLNKL